MKNFASMKDAKTLLITALVASFALSACGIKGNLDRPAPLWGPDNSQAEKPNETPDSEDRDEDLFEDELYGDDLDPDINF